MKATIWHNPRCSKSRQTLEILRDRQDLEIEVIEYLRQPPTREKLAQLYRDAGMEPVQGLRMRGTDARNRGLADAGAAAVLDAICGDPALIERPLVETGKGARLCRPSEKVLEIL